MPKKTKIILGVDPGSILLGYAFLKATGQKVELLSMGVLDMRKMDSQAQKMSFIYSELDRLIQYYEPSTGALEDPFYGKNAQSMLKLGRAQGAVMAVMGNHGLSVAEYSPRSIKKAVTGKGAASKEQVAAMLPHLIKGDFHHDFLDATDAVGVAYCHYLQGSSASKGGKRYKGWGDFLNNNPKRKG
ncbi:crossover junction endodeoxyribonuclease RuvC [Saprospira grandis]|uniref:crossover junction endodeoxyribonuclease RuvC n=1 Tax=Saprospira grandis TaxID=1008 RepID=UPI0022DD8624|nr:crossover junction endodeoxyribonuclease RuvC [Saprospira grandis]WBM76112.1 crossover junction endodeoxyribonuclease RuvC [Saprospira grandis]